MKKLLLTLAALPMAALAGPASAQSGYQYQNPNAGGSVGVQNRVMQLELRLNAGVQQGTISRSEQRSLQQQISRIRQLESQYSANGLTQRERRTLQQQIRTVRDQLRTAYGNGYAYDDSRWDNYGYQYGASAYGNTAVSYDQYGRPIATSRVVYDQYGRPISTGGIAYDQYGRPVSNGYYGQGGPYESVPRTNSGIGNILSGVLGGGNGASGMLGSILGNGGLNVGDIITGVIGSSLGRGSSLGYQDRNDVYFRTDGERVYEIDARTNRVIRIHPAR